MKIRLVLITDFPSQLYRNVLCKYTIYCTTIMNTIIIGLTIQQRDKGFKWHRRQTETGREGRIWETKLTEVREGGGKKGWGEGRGPRQCRSHACCQTGIRAWSGGALLNYFWCKPIYDGREPSSRARSIRFSSSVKSLLVYGKPITTCLVKYRTITFRAVMSDGQVPHNY